MKVISRGDISLESMPDAPDAAWLRTFLDDYNDLKRKAVAALGALNLGDNSASREKVLNMVHGTEYEITIPLENGVALKSVAALQCEGLTLDSSKKATVSTYALALAQPVRWRLSTNEGKVLVRTDFAPSTIGERIPGVVPVGSAVSLTSGSTKDVTSIQLTPGVWDVSTLVQFGGSPAAPVTYINAGSSSVSAATLGATMQGTEGDQYASQGIVTSANYSQNLVVPSFRYTLAATTTVYLVAKGVFTSSLVAWGRISATRVDIDPSTTARMRLLFVGE